jgi:hypothetical protein
MSPCTCVLCYYSISNISQGVQERRDASGMCWCNISGDFADDQNTSGWDTSVTWRYYTRGWSTSPEVRCNILGETYWVKHMGCNILGETYWVKHTG